MEIKKIEKSNFVMFPRMQHRGLQFRHVERDAYRAELRHVEGHGDYWLLHQQSKPHVVAHVQLPKTEAEFDNILGWCLGQNHWCEYIEGDLSFLCVIAGFRSALWDACQSKNAEELTPKYPDFIRDRVYALSDATRWWYEYGKETLILKDVQNFTM